jgi:hypothetical protein
VGSFKDAPWRSEVLWSELGADKVLRISEASNCAGKNSAAKHSVSNPHNFLPIFLSCPLLLFSDPRHLRFAAFWTVGENVIYTGLLLPAGASVHQIRTNETANTSYKSCFASSVAACGKHIEGK